MNSDKLIKNANSLPTHPNKQNDDFNLSKLNSMDCWDYTIELECLQGPQDLQLAAELGKTLLERNKELECLVKQQQNTIDDQSQEIEYLTKQTVALREVNDSRLRIYEQLEVSIQDLETSKHRLVVESSSDKKHLKTLTSNLEQLESKYEELSSNYDEINRLLEMERRKNEKILNEHRRNNFERKTAAGEAGTASHDLVKLRLNDDTLNSGKSQDEIDCTSTPFDTSANFNFSFDMNNSNSKCSSFIENVNVSNLEDEEHSIELMKIVTDLEQTRKQYYYEHNRSNELEEQLTAAVQENKELQTKIGKMNTDEIKSIHDELSILDEVRHGPMCSRCLRGLDERSYGGVDEEVSLVGTEDDDDRSLMDLISNAKIYQSSVKLELDAYPQNHPSLLGSITNPYRELVEKYEALLEVQRTSLLRNNNRQSQPSMQQQSQHMQQQQQHQQLNHQQPNRHTSNASHSPQMLSLQDELLHSGDFSSLNTKFTDEDNRMSIKNNGVSGGVRRKICLTTPTDFSEADTLSSGFSDETCHKYTQTEERAGSFLCTIADGEDCKFSIYDDASPIDSRFRNRPEYRELFREIFTVLKKAAENRDEGEKLPLLDDTLPTQIPKATKVPPVTPATEELPQFNDDTESVVSSTAPSEKSVAMSERITRKERRKIQHQKKQNDIVEQENTPPVGVRFLPDGRLMTPYKREPHDYLGIGSSSKKKRNRRKNSNSSLDRSETVIPSPPRVFIKKGRTRQLTNPEQIPNSNFEWNGNSMTIYNRSNNKPGNSSVAGNNAEDGAFGGSNSGTQSPLPEILFKPSTASHDLHKLKKLDLSYAEVLRRADQQKNFNLHNSTNSQHKNGHRRK